ncbi:uncharacterized protein LOC142135729 [Mixophyes fleayi]|uniref:uncharacterized protein LOC142135729 n=1 Tax=Mixophyes fleayi TaxID=3061075 RepID=UPI003F4E101A
MGMMRFQIVEKDNIFVKVDNCFAEEVMENVIDIMLEYHWGITQSKWHDKIMLSILSSLKIVKLERMVNCVKSSREVKEQERKPKTQLPGNCPTSEPCSDRDRVRLTNNCSGRVQVYYQGGWGTVCDDDWDMKDAEVVCKQVGCGPAMNATGGALHGSGTGPIWLSEVNCRGYEQVLQDCWTLRWNMSDCLHKEDAGVVCMENYPPPTTVTTSDLGRLRTVQPPSYIPTVFLVVFIVSVTLVGMGIIVVGVLIKRMQRYKRALRNMYSVSSQEPVYEEIDLRMMKKYQSVSQESVFYPDGLDEKLEYYTSEERHHMMPEPGSSLENKMTEYDDTGLSYENLNNDETTTDGSKGICKQSQVRKSRGRKKTRKSSEKEEDLSDDPERRREMQQYLLLKSSGWIPDGTGKWVKDETVEFDSDEEEPPAMPPP